MRRVTRVEVVVVGAGPGGLAVAAALKARGVEALVVDRTPRVGSSWRGHYDRLHLHTPRRWSGLPGYPIPRRFGRWVARDDVVRYLEEYAAHHRLTLRLGSGVTRVDRSGPGAPEGARWVVRLEDGAIVEARHVVIATGNSNTLDAPDWPGLDGFTGEVVLATDYRNGRPYAGRDVLVVGTGNTGTEIATDLAEHGATRVWLSVRTPPHIVPRTRLGWPAQGTGILVHRLPPRVVDRLGPCWRSCRNPTSRHTACRSLLPMSTHACSWGASPCRTWASSRRSGPAGSSRWPRSCRATGPRSCSRTARASGRMPSSWRPATARTSSPSSATSASSGTAACPGERRRGAAGRSRAVVHRVPAHDRRAAARAAHRRGTHRVGSQPGRRSVSSVNPWFRSRSTSGIPMAVAGVSTPAASGSRSASSTRASAAWPSMTAVPL